MGHDLRRPPGAGRRPRLVLLDAERANPGDLSWDGLAALGELEVYDRSPDHAVVKRCRGATVAITNKTLLRRASLEALPELGLVSVLATGVNVVDLEAAHALGITVSNVPNYSTPSTAQHTIALLLELCHHVGEHSRGAREGRWSRAQDFSYWDYPLHELDGLTLGLVGFGAIARRVAAIAQALGMQVIVLRRTPREEPGVRVVDKETLFRESDVVSLHCPLTAETQHLVDERALAWMKPSAFLINTSRGQVIDEPALARALRADVIAGAALDVLSQEPPPPDHPLLHAPRCIITPHIAWATRAARSRVIAATVQNVSAFLAGAPTNVCTP